MSEEKQLGPQVWREEELLRRGGSNGGRESPCESEVGMLETTDDDEEEEKEGEVSDKLDDGDGGDGAACMEDMQAKKT